MAFRICQERFNTKEHWMLYYKLHAGCLVVLVFGGFQAPKRQQKTQSHLKESMIKNKKHVNAFFVATNMFYEKTI